jgi:hypothetical protein
LLLTKNYYVATGIVIVAIITLALMPSRIKTAHFKRSQIFIKTYHNRFNQHVQLVITNSFVEYKNNISELKTKVSGMIKIAETGWYILSKKMWVVSSFPSLNLPVQMK